MRNLIVTIAALLLAASGSATSFGVDERPDDWVVTIKFGDSMAGQGETRSGEECAFIWEFSEGRKGVTFLGEDARVNLNDIWDTGAKSKTRTRVGDRQSGETSPELIVLLSIRILPLSGDDLKVRMAVTRWGLIAEPPPRDYRFDSEVLDREIGIGDALQFLGGRGLDGKEYFLEMTIEPTGNGQRKIIRSNPRVAPIRFKYRLITPSNQGRGEFAAVRDIVLSQDEELEPVEIQAPIDIRGIDSSLLSIDIKLNDIILREASDQDQFEIDAVFELERWLFIDIKPSLDTTRMNLSQMISSSYNHAIHLRPNKKIRIEIPAIESGKYVLDAREIIEIEPIVIEKKTQ